MKTETMNRLRRRVEDANPQRAAARLYVSAAHADKLGLYNMGTEYRRRAADVIGRNMKWGA